MYVSLSVIPMYVCVYIYIYLIQLSLPFINGKVQHAAHIQNHYMVAEYIIKIVAANI